MTTDRHIAIVGLGYVGLPLALSFVEVGCRVVGVDASPERVAELRAGHSPIDDIDDARLAAGLADGLTVALAAEADVASADVVFVCVPTPITQSKDPDLEPVLSAARELAGAYVLGSW